MPKSFEPVFDERARMLILGTMPSVRSREEGFYYAHPRNRFWRVVAECFGESVPQSVEEKKRLLFAHGIALWDVLAECEIFRSDDASIRKPVCHDIAGFLHGKSIRKILCNGGKAYQLLKRFVEVPIPAAAMPSTSPANAAWGVERLVRVWGTELNEGENCHE